MTEFEQMVYNDMLANGYFPDLWADIVEYWNERLA